jgi:hypothetical protein
VNKDKLDKHMAQDDHDSITLHLRNNDEMHKRMAQSDDGNITLLPRKIRLAAAHIE